MMQIVTDRSQIRVSRIPIISFPEKVIIIGQGMNICIILYLVFVKIFDKIFQNILVGIMEQSGLGGWVSGFIRS